MQHLEHLSLLLRGRRSTWSTSVSFCVAGAARGAPPERSAEVRRGLNSYCGRRLRLRGRRSTWSTSVSFSVAGAARGAPPERSAEVRRGLNNYCGHLWMPAAFAWQAQHLEHLSLILRGRRSTWSTSVSFLRGKCSTRSTSVSFCVAGAAHGAPAERSAEVGRPLSTVMGSFKGSCSIIIPFCTSIYTSPSTQHHLHTTIYTTSSTQHHLHYIIKHNIINTHHLHYIIKHNIINTTSSTHHHLNNTTYTTPSAQHHPHNTIYTTGAALGTLPSYPFCLIPADTPLVILRCGLFFVLFR